VDRSSFGRATKESLPVQSVIAMAAREGLRWPQTQGATVVNIVEAIQNYGPGRKHLLNERCTQTIAGKVVKPGDTVLDLGANEGFHTFDLVRHVGETGMVHAFEPNPEMWPNLAGRANIRLWPMAVGDRISVENFYIPRDHIYHQVGSLIDPRDFIGSVEMTVLTVPQVTLDALEELPKSGVTFVKMDIERRELACFRGMTQILLQSAPVIVFENLTDEIAAVDLLANVLAAPDERVGELGLIALDAVEIGTLMAEVEAATPE
jgi:FkbM family methyltransferase